GDAAEDWASDRDARGLPGVPARVLDVRAEERDEHRPGRVEPLALRLEPVAHLVEEEQQDDAEPEPPAPDERIAAERDEHGAELGERPQLGQQAEEHQDRCGNAPPETAPVGATRPDRVVVALGELVPHLRPLYSFVRSRGRSTPRRPRTPLS